MALFKCRISLSLSLEGVETSLSQSAQKTPPPLLARGVLVLLVRVGGVEHTLREYYHTSNVVQSRDVEKKIAFCIVEYYSQTSSCVFCQVL